MRRLTLSGPSRLGERAGAIPEPMVSSVRFDLTAALLNAWLLGGTYLDGWAHIHVPDLETFFTPWHGVLYAGFFASALFLLLTLARNIGRGRPLRSSLPAGYGLSIAGAGLFLAGGGGDLVWHTLFGIEANVEALLSPTHLLLALGGSLLSTGPLRAAWYRSRAEASAGKPGAWTARLPMLLSLTFLLSTFAFFTEYASPFAHTLAAGASSGSGVSTYRIQALAITSILLQSAFLMGIVLFTLRRFRLPFGSMTLIVGLSTTLITLMHNGLQATGPAPLIGVGVVAGLASDVLGLWLRPSVAKAAAFRMYAFAVPALVYALYFAALQVFGGGIAWSIHLWTGSIMLAGVTGWLLSYAYIPPASMEG